MNYSRVRDIPETCPIYREADIAAQCLKDDLNLMLQPEMLEKSMDYIAELLECVDRCREIAGDLRDMCIERGELIERLEEKIGEME